MTFNGSLKNGSNRLTIIHRQWQILRMICDTEWTLKDIADVFGVSTKTIRRDIGSLRQLFPLLVIYPRRKPKSARGTELYLNNQIVTISRKRLISALCVSDRRRKTA